MSVDIGPRIGIDGEAEFRKNLNNINQQLKTLGPEMTAWMPSATRLPAAIFITSRLSAASPEASLKSSIRSPAPPVS